MTQEMSLLKSSCINLYEVLMMSVMSEWEDVVLWGYWMVQKQEPNLTKPKKKNGFMFSYQTW